MADSEKPDSLLRYVLRALLLGVLLGVLMFVVYVGVAVIRAW